MWKRAQCFMRCISLDKNEKVDIVTVPTMPTSSQPALIVQENNKSLGCPRGHSCQMPSHIKDPESTHTLELGSCSPNFQSLICVGSGFSQ